MPFSKFNWSPSPIWENECRIGAQHDKFSLIVSEKSFEEHVKNGGQLSPHPLWGRRIQNGSTIWQASLPWWLIPNLILNGRTVRRRRRWCPLPKKGTLRVSSLTVAIAMRSTNSSLNMLEKDHINFSAFSSVVSDKKNPSPLMGDQELAHKLQWPGA